MGAVILPITIKKEGALYTARAWHFTPDVKDFIAKKGEWVTPHPMTLSELSKELTERGFHPLDVSDALMEADPSLRLPRPPRSSSSDSEQR
jgi:hypothetical protein